MVSSGGVRRSLRLRLGTAELRGRRGDKRLPPEQPNGKCCLGVMHKYRILLHYAGRQRRSYLIISVLTVAASLLAAVQP